MSFPKIETGTTDTSLHQVWDDIEDEDATQQENPSQPPVTATIEENEALDTPAPPENEADEDNMAVIEQPVAVRRSTRIHKPPTWHSSYDLSSTRTKPSHAVNVASINLSPVFNAFMAQLVKDADPISYKQALQQQEWVNAMNEELHALEMNDT